MLDQFEYEQIERALHAAAAVPFIAEVENFVWESIWAYSQGLPNPSRRRKKLLYDIVDPNNKIGWSAKTLQWPHNNGTCEFVIQRADVIKKREDLGYPGLSVETSPPQELGTAVLKHWRLKVENDKEAQGVTDSRLALLLKLRGTDLVYPYEEPLTVPNADDLEWRWTNDNKTGLQARDASGNLRYRWYQNQKQLFESFDLEDTTSPINLAPNMLTAEDFVKKVGF